MNAGRPWFRILALVLGFAFLYIPIVSLVVFSFNESRLVTVWGGFSTKWYGALLDNQQIIGAALLSLKIAAISATIAVALGTLTGMALARFGPFRGRTLLVFHPAYGYFARRYGLVQIAVESEGKAPSSRQLAEIVDSLRDRNTPAIFVQPQFSQTAARRVADALGCQVVMLDPLAEEYLVNLESMAERIATAMAR